MTKWGYFRSIPHRRRQWQPTSVLLPGKSHGQRSLIGCCLWGHKSLTWLSDFIFTFHFHALEKEMATHSSVLAWRMPGAGEPGGLPSMGLHRVGHDWSDLAAVAAAALSPFMVQYLKALFEMNMLFENIVLNPKFEEWQAGREIIL